jgi:hypothetical protein
MYAIIHKGRVIVGPMGWTRGYFTDVLKIRHRITASLPNEAPSEFPFVVDEDTVIKQATENRPECNPMIQQYYGPLWDVSGEVAVANYEVHDLSIESAQNNHKILAAQARYKKEIKGIKVNVQNTEVTVDTDRGSRDIFAQKYLLMTELETINWKFPEGWLTLSKTELGTVVAASTQYVQECFDWEKNIVDEIMATTTLEQLLDIEIVEKESTPELPE